MVPHKNINILISHLWQRGHLIYLFYEDVSMNLNWNPGDKLKCYHGQCKTLTIMKAIQSSLNGKSFHRPIITWEFKYIPIGLIGHLKTHFPAMYQFFLILKDCHEPPTNVKVALASRKKMLDQIKAAEYLIKLEKALASIVVAFAKKNQRAAVNTLFLSLLCSYH